MEDSQIGDHTGDAASNVIMDSNQGAELVLHLSLEVDPVQDLQQKQ